MVKIIRMKKRRRTPAEMYWYNEGVKARKRCTLKFHPRNYVVFEPVDIIRIDRNAFKLSPYKIKRVLNYIHKLAKETFSIDRTNKRLLKEAIKWSKDIDTTEYEKYTVDAALISLNSIEGGWQAKQKPAYRLMDIRAGNIQMKEGSDLVCRMDE